MIRGVEFGHFELDLVAYELRASGRVIKLEKIPLDMLILFAQRPGALVARADVKAALWGADVFVDHDAAINTAVRKIRRALADDPNRPRFLQTVIGKGYRFIAPVLSRQLTDEGRGATSAAAARFPLYHLTHGKRHLTLKPGENVVGRDPTSRVHIDHPSVSRRHARIVVGPTSAVIEDLGSRNGTFLDGRRVATRACLDHGAVVGFGPVAFKLLVLSAPGSTASVGGPRRRRKS